MVDLIELPVQALEVAEKKPFLAQHFPNFFADGALIPLNPHRWGPYWLGSTMASDMPDWKDKVSTPVSNLKVVNEYLESSLSDIQYRDRFWKVRTDTLKINAACEVDEGCGAFAAAPAANKVADHYMEEMGQTTKPEICRSNLGLILKYI